MFLKTVFLWINQVFLFRDSAHCSFSKYLCKLTMKVHFNICFKETPFRNDNVNGFPAEELPYNSKHSYAKYIHYNQSWENFS